MEERQGVTTYQPTTTNPSVEGVPIIELGEEYSSIKNPPTSTPVLVQLPPSHDSTFNFPTKGYSGAQEWVFSPPSDDLVVAELVQMLLFGRLPWDGLFLNTAPLL